MERVLKKSLCLALLASCAAMERAPHRGSTDEPALPTSTAQSPADVAPADAATWRMWLDLLHAYDLERVIPLLEEGAENLHEPAFLFFLAQAHVQVGRRCDAIAELELAADRFAEAGDSRSAANCRVERAHRLFEAGLVDEATAEYRACLAEHGDAFSEKGTLPSIVSALADQPRTDDIARLAVRPVDALEPWSCLPNSLRSILAYWGLELEAAQVRSVRGRWYELMPFVRSLGFEAVPFVVERENVHRLLRSGYPVLVAHEATWNGEEFDHASVLTGFDARRRLFLTIDSNWMYGRDTFPEWRIEGCRAFLIAPPESMPASLPSFASIAYASLLIEGDRLLVADRLDEAEFLYASLTSPDSATYGWGQWGLGQCWDQRRVADRAVEALTRASTVAPFNLQASAWVQLGELQVDLGRLMEAHASFDEALRLHCKSFAALRGLSFIGHMTGQYETALSYADQAVEVKPNCATVHYYRACALQQLGRLEEARAASDRFLELGGWDQDPSEYLVSMTE
jgi:tetratricopeptide (TPR) repeat protein